MSNAALAVVLFLAYAITDQWAFRCQRVGRGILLLAKDTAAGHHGLFTAIVPGRFVNAVWLARLLWVAALFFAWRAWGWPGVLPIVLYNFVLGVFVDNISPWPSYSVLLQSYKRHIGSGAAGLEGMLLLPTIGDIEKAMAAGGHFERVTTGVWLGRAIGAADAMNEADRTKVGVPPTVLPPT